jgi:hypothetical protein
LIRVASHWKATIHIYNLKKFQKIQKFIAFRSACPKSLNPTYGSPRPLGVNSPKEDPKVESQKIKQNSIYAIWTKGGSFGVFFF